MKHAVAPLLESISNLSGARVPTLCTGISVYFRDVYDHLQRLNQTADSIRDTVATAISVNLRDYAAGERDHEAPGSLCGAAGRTDHDRGDLRMNFEHMPELKWRYGYALSLLLMTGLDIYLFFRFKRARWL